MSFAIFPSYKGRRLAHERGVAAAPVLENTSIGIRTPGIQTKYLRQKNRA